MTIEKKIKAARAAVNKEVFGTPEWEAKMAVVRELVDEQNSTQNFNYTSIDGDVFSV